MLALLFLGWFGLIVSMVGILHATGLFVAAAFLFFWTIFAIKLVEDE